MSYSTTERKIGELNEGITNAYEAGEPISVPVNGRPQLHIMSFDPLAYEKYGMFQSRAPKLVGLLALRLLLTCQIPGGALVYAALESGERVYGFEMNSYRPADVSVLNRVSLEVGHPEFMFHPPR